MSICHRNYDKENDKKEKNSVLWKKIDWASKLSFSINVLFFYNRNS
jgi:hypothetical protein